MAYLVTGKGFAPGITGQIHLTLEKDKGGYTGKKERDPVAAINIGWHDKQRMTWTVTDIGADRIERVLTKITATITANGGRVEGLGELRKKVGGNAETLGTALNLGKDRGMILVGTEGRTNTYTLAE